MSRDDYDLVEFGRMLRESHENTQRREREFLERLGEQDVFVPDDASDKLDEGDKSGTGYWRVPGGVITYRRGYSGKYQFHSREEITESEIGILNQLVSMDVSGLPENRGFKVHSRENVKVLPRIEGFLENVTAIRLSATSIKVYSNVVPDSDSVILEDESGCRYRRVTYPTQRWLIFERI